MSQRSCSIFTLLAVVAIAALIGIGLWRSRAEGTPLVSVQATPRGVMGTACKFTAVARFNQLYLAEDALDAAEQQVRGVESLMSVHLAGSEIDRFNAAAAGAPFPLTADTLSVLTQARRLAEATDGAFDVTCYPLVRLWSAAGKAGRVPDPRELAEALKRVGIQHLQFDPCGVTKLVEGVEADLGGIAKGYAVDKALLTIKSAGLAGGLVEIGGDLRCFGATDRRKPWVIGIRHPFAKDKTCGTLLLSEAAVATSGDYERSFEIDGRRYSHILDPRTGLPVEYVPSVTVVSRAGTSRHASAAEADAWATALSVMGPSGMECVEGIEGLEAMMVLGTPQELEIRKTSGFEALLEPGTKVELD